MSHVKSSNTAYAGTERYIYLCVHWQSTRVFDDIVRVHCQVSLFNSRGRNASLDNSRVSNNNMCAPSQLARLVRLAVCMIK